VEETFKQKLMGKMLKVTVLWVDAYTVDEWMSYEFAIRSCSDNWVVETTGYLLDETDEHITICHTYSPEQVCGLMHIPKGAIEKIIRHDKKTKTQKK
jgi:hypothetical protein